MTPFHTRADVGLRQPRSVSRNVTGEGDTAHYGGPSPWSGADLSSPERFAATTSHARCPSIWRAWQAFHMDTRGWVDIAYSSGVCPHGHRYEGRGPGVRTAANGTTDGNNRSLATVYIAGDADPLTEPAKAAFLDEGRRLARLRWGHRDWKSTACPGEPLYAWRAAGWPAPTEEDPMSALSDDEQRELLRLLRTVEDRTQRHLILDRDQYLDPEAHAVARANAKTLVIGAIGHGLNKVEGRKPEPGEGDLRGLFRGLIDEALDARLGPADPAG